MSFALSKSRESGEFPEEPMCKNAIKVIERLCINHFKEQFKKCMVECNEKSHKTGLCANIILGIDVREPKVCHFLKHLIVCFSS